MTDLSSMVGCSVFSSGNCGVSNFCVLIDLFTHLDAHITIFGHWHGRRRTAKEGILQSGHTNYPAVADGWNKAFANNERLQTTGAATPWLCDTDSFKDSAQLGIEEINVAAAEDLSDKLAAGSENAHGQV